MKTHAPLMNRTLWCTVLAGSLLGYGGLAWAAHEQSHVTPGEILMIPHKVPHVSTVPANKGDPVELSVVERVRGDSPGGKPRKAFS
jgi:hypothetical protein